MSEDITTILTRIKKLLALSTSANPNEAAAAAKAQALLMQYNLTLHQVEASEHHTSAYGKQAVAIGSRVWKRRLLQAIAEHNFCETVYLSGVGRSALIGQAHNQEAVVAMYHSLVTQLEPMASTAYRQSRSLLHAKSWMDSFYMGAVESIWRRLEAQKQTMVAESNDCRALVVTKNAELHEAMQRFFPRVRNAPQKHTRSADGYSSGYQAGQRVTLHKALPETV